MHLQKIIPLFQSKILFEQFLMPITDGYADF